MARRQTWGAVFGINAMKDSYKSGRLGNDMVGLIDDADHWALSL
jgi:hypothetical protein